MIVTCLCFPFSFPVPIFFPGAETKEVSKNNMDNSCDVRAYGIVPFTVEDFTFDVY